MSSLLKRTQKQFSKSQEKKFNNNINHTYNMTHVRIYDYKYCYAPIDTNNNNTD